jgi:hypothetical protein
VIPLASPCRPFKEPRTQFPAWPLLILCQGGLPPGVGDGVRGYRYSTESPSIPEKSLRCRTQEKRISGVTFLHKSTAPALPRSLLDELRLVDNRYIGLMRSHFPILYIGKCEHFSRSSVIRVAISCYYSEALR